MSHCNVYKGFPITSRFKYPEIIIGSQSYIPGSWKITKAKHWWQFDKRTWIDEYYIGKNPMSGDYYRLPDS